VIHDRHSATGGNDSKKTLDLIDEMNLADELPPEPTPKAEAP
jgi:hypothetical protein